MKVLRHPALLLAGLVLVLCLLGWAGASWQQWRAGRRVEQLAAAQRQAAARSLARQQAADSVRLTLAGRALEAHDHTTLTQSQYDSLRHLLPATLPVLPAQPPRYRPDR